MTELAHIATQTPAEATICDKYLKLPAQGDRTVYTVYAKAIDPSTQADGKPRVAFACDPDATEWFTRGIKWMFSKEQVEYGLFLSFVLLEGVEELEYSDRPTLPYWFSTPWVPQTGSAPGLTNQLCCTQLVAEHKIKYHFRAKLSDWGPVDPVIVVTPINTTGDGDDDSDDDDDADGADHRRDRSSLTALAGGRAENTAQDCVAGPDLLVLTNGGAFTVDVKIANNGPVFSVPPTPINPNPPQHTDGVHWLATKANQSVVLTFKYLSPAITGLVSQSLGLTFSNVAGGQVTNSLSAPGSDSINLCFDVITPEGRVRGVYDPVIVVTPINTEGDGG